MKLTEKQKQKLNEAISNLRFPALSQIKDAIFPVIEEILTETVAFEKGKLSSSDK